MKRPIELHIDELVLHGFDPHQRHEVGDAVQAELMRLLGVRNDGLSARRVTHDVEIPHLDGGSFTLRPSAQAAGEGIARSVHTALGGKRG